MAKRRLIHVPSLDENTDESFCERIDPVNRFKAQKRLKETANETDSVQSRPSASENVLQTDSSTRHVSGEHVADVAMPKEKVVSLEPKPLSTVSGNGKTSAKSKCIIPSENSESRAPMQNKPIVPKPSGKTNNILVNTRQRGNPILKFIRNIPLEYSDIVPDYVLGQSTCALYLSLRYHTLNPNYIHDRLKQLGRNFALRVLLVQVDVKDPHHSIKELTKICIFADCTMLLSWSPEESGRYLEAYKVFENKPADLLMEKQENNPMAKLVDAMTNIKSVNRTNAKTLLSTFRSFKNIAEADQDLLSFCPGVGLQKAERIYKTLHEPFLKYSKNS